MLKYSKVKLALEIIVVRFYHLVSPCLEPLIAATTLLVLPALTALALAGLSLSGALNAAALSGDSVSCGRSLSLALVWFIPWSGLA